MFEKVCKALTPTADIASHHVYPLCDNVQIERGSAVLIIITSVIPDPTVENGHPFPSKGPFDGTSSYMDLRCNLGPCHRHIYALSESCRVDRRISLLVSLPRQCTRRLSKLVLIHSRQARCSPHCVRSDGTDGAFRNSRNRTRILPCRATARGTWT